MEHKLEQDTSVTKWQNIFKVDKGTLRSGFLMLSALINIDYYKPDS